MQGVAVVRRQVRAMWAVLPACLLIAVAGSAQSPGRNCKDDRRVDRCRPEQQAETRALFGVLPAEEQAAAGAQVRRVFYVDGYGRDLLMISMTRRGGGTPTLRVHLPRKEGRVPEPMSAAMPEAMWREVLTRSASLRDVPSGGLMRTVEMDGQTFVAVCLHSWVYTAEAADPGWAAARRFVASACGDTPVEEFAAFVQEVALPLYPACLALDAKQLRNQATQLATCAALDGDRTAAAQVRNLLVRFSGAGGAKDASRLEGLFHADAALSWGGERPGAGDAAAFWAERAASAGATGGWANLYVDTVAAPTPDSVRVKGALVRTVDTPRGAGTGQERAEVEQVWTRGVDGAFRIARATVGRWTGG